MDHIASGVMDFSALESFVVHIIAIFSLTMKSSTWFFSMNFAKVYRIRYFPNSWLENAVPFVVRLQIALLKTFKVKSSSIKE